MCLLRKGVLRTFAATLVLSVSLQAGPALAVVEAATGLRTRMVGNATLLAALPSEGDQHAQ